MNIANEVKRMKTIQYMCSSCGMFCNGDEKTFGSLAKRSVLQCHVLYALSRRFYAVVRTLPFHKCSLGSILTSTILCQSRMLVIYSTVRGFPQVIRFSRITKNVFDLL